MKKKSVLASVLCLALVLVACGTGEGTTSNSVVEDNTISQEENTEESQELEENSNESFGNLKESDGNRAVNRENMTDNVTAEKFQGLEGKGTMEGMEIPEGTDTESRTAMRENMDMSDKTAMRENMGMGTKENQGNITLPEGFESMSQEEKQEMMQNQGFERGDNAETPATENMNVSDNLSGKVTLIEDNVFTLLLESGDEKIITIPNDLTVANGDYTRILLGMNLSVGFNEEDKVISVAIVR